MPTDRLATSKEVADYLGVHPKSLDRWASTGGGPPFIRMSGGTRRYEWTDVRNWLDSKKVSR